MTQDEVYAWVAAASLAGRVAVVAAMGVLLACAGAPLGLIVGFALGCVVGAVVFGRWS